MITNYNERKNLGVTLLPCVGFDRKGKSLYIGNDVQVVIEEPERIDDPKYNFCSAGIRGVIIEKGQGWIVIVDFGTRDNIHDPLGCTDYYLLKLN